MKKSTHENDLSSLAEDARALMAATADVAGEKAVEARKRLAVALDSFKGKAANCAKSAHETIQEHPYHAIGIAFGLGALAGCLVACRRSRNDE